MLPTPATALDLNQLPIDQFMVGQMQASAALTQAAAQLQANMTDLAAAINMQFVLGSPQASTPIKLQI